MSDLDRLIQKYGFDKEEILQEAIRMANETTLYPLKQLRKSKKITQKELAERMDTTQGNISRIENGELDNISIATLRKYFAALDTNVTLSFFTDGTLTLNDEQKNVA